MRNRIKYNFNGVNSVGISEPITIDDKVLHAVISLETMTFIILDEKNNPIYTLDKTFTSLQAMQRKIKKVLIGFGANIEPEKRGVSVLESHSETEEIIQKLVPSTEKDSVFLTPTQTQETDPEIFIF